MTLIAAYHYEGVTPCFIFGDGLLTTTENFKPTHKVHLPIKSTFYDSPLSGKSYISNLRQKVSIINRNLVIAWAGRLDAATTIFNGLYETFSHNDSIKYSAFEKHMLSLPKHLFENCCIIGLLTDDAGKEKIFSRGDKRSTPTLPDISHCIASGSGVSEFKRMKKVGRGSLAVRDDLRAHAIITSYSTRA